MSERVPGHDPRRVVHLVGRLTEPVFDFLRPATEAIAQTGVEQCVIVLDDPRRRHLLARFDPRVQVLSTPDERGLLQRWASMRQVYRRVLTEQPPTAVHLHGVVSWLLGAGIARRTAGPTRLYYSPHGSDLLGWGRVSNAVLLRVMQRLQRRSAEQTIVTLSATSRSLPGFGGQAAAVIESPINRVFLETLPNTARRPLIVTSSRVDRPRSALAFAQLAVLLGDQSLGLSFNWIGAASAESRAALKAASVAVFDVQADEERAQRLSCGWVYLAVGDSPGFPLFLVEAMALGLPCIALDTPYTRAVLRDGDTGFLCKNSSQIRQAIANLIDAPDLRQRLGRAARLDALERFGEARFRHSVLAAYALPAA